MSSQKTEVNVLLSGEQGFVYQNLRYQLQEAPGLGLVTSAASEEPAPEFVVYVFDDLESRCSGECRLPHEEKTSAIARYLDAGSRVVLLMNRESDVSMVGSPNMELCRIPQVFGKWSTTAPANPVGYLCSLVIDGQEAMYDQQADMELLYVDDLAKAVIDGIVSGELARCGKTAPYRITGRELVALLVRFRESRDNLVIPPVGSGLFRALYATYISYLDKADFSYPLINHSDERGNFIEILKTESHGQISCLTAGPGVTRGQHYHHSKSEKFLVVKGKARFCFRNLLTDEYHELTVTGSKPEIVETIPGWVHNITNISDEEMIVILWANEIFNPDCPDTNPGKI